MSAAMIVEFLIMKSLEMRKLGSGGGAHGSG